MSIAPLHPRPEDRPLHLVRPDEAPAPAEDMSPRAQAAGLLLAVLLGAAVRLGYTLSEGFPLNDGGLFFAMTQDLQASGYALPDVTSYNAAGIPYAYPPLAFYLAAALNDLGLSLETIFRIVPLLASVALIPAFFLLARRILPSRVAVVSATVLLALLPRAFFWMIMGGGITRALGFTFAVFALWALVAAYQDRRQRYVFAAAVFGALAALSHVQMAWFVGFSGVILLAAYGRHRFGLYTAITAGSGAALLSAPWWLTVMAHHGLSPFLAAIFAGDTTESPLAIALSLRFSGESLFPLIVALGLMGLVLTLAQRRYLLASWFAASLLLDQRAVGTVASVPLALLGGLAVEHLWHLLSARRSTGRTTAPGWLMPSLCAATVLYVFLSGTIAGARWLGALSADERDAMAWMSRNTPQSSQVLVITGDKWYADRTSEWFPYLAQRESLATAQGYEWAPDRAFDERLSSYRAAQRCADSDSACLDAWSAQHDADVDYVYIPRVSPISRPSAGATDRCCAALLQSLALDGRYTLVYDGPGALVYERR